MEILNNPWVAGIGSSVISGLIVYFATNWLISKRQNKEYLQKIKIVNNELLYAVRPLIVKKQIPSKRIMESMIESIARKHEVEKKDVLSLSLIVDDLIREVLENPFLDSEQKIDFCNKIDELRGEKEISKKLSIVTYSKDRISSRYLSTTLALTVSTMVLFIGLFMAMNSSFREPSFSRIFLEHDSFNLSAISLIGIVAPMLAIMISLVFKKNINHAIKKMINQNNHKNK